MAEVTRVPIQPVAKGSLTKLWLGVILAVLVGGGLAWAAMTRGLNVETLVEGEGDTIEAGDVAWVKYTGKLASTGEVFDQTQELPPQIAQVVRSIFPEGSPWEMQEGTMIPGFFDGLLQMREGGTYELFIPADQAYGDQPPEGSPIPPGADLVFEIEVTGVMSQEKYERDMAVLQRLMQSQMGGPPGAGGPQGPPPTLPQGE
ncbi:FKBP-type peptidyl-prolyl cis-trans isomerase [Erythrobacter sp. HL-111]|uniref:FKBP-type peptidyl-prolyl cis-trans isomerase n=1 Tax=Erythrobacter sp. HL-111 TaxID=1798193 RepID=UPI0006DAD5CB|nr:FKBP-type peptidyl-prolyl cis-trans isomerase [Erythrobacter sp. HL-111]KPP88108.1 MAG: FKBP-type peptidyl-prolyl cis-trans isomerases 1 [Erythrobacteraceae bacterium HL-111]SDT09448.1 FKBP-type peptidyl-prolyl cis-trans isomerase [Erythrobacter sp. HL-111]